jgi:SNF2 family DNA or RNA helicase
MQQLQERNPIHPAAGQYRAAAQVLRNMRTQVQHPRKIVHTTTEAFKLNTRQKFTPRPYQTMIIDHILGKQRCAVWAGMGTGKTVATLTALEALQMAEDGPALVVAPLRVATTTWPEEVLKWEHLKGMNVVPIVGTERERIAAVRTPSPVYTTNYEQLVWLVAYWGDQWPYSTVVLDESTKVKGFRLRQGGKRAQALGSIAHTRIRRLIELTGTPASNGIKDLWGQSWFLDAGVRLGRTYGAFSQRWFRPDQSGYGLEPLRDSQTEVQDRLRDVCLTIDAKDWFDLRTPIINDIMVKLPAKARKHYDEMEKEMFTELDTGEEIEAFNAAAKTQKCLQIANGAMYVAGSVQDWEEIHKVKLEALESVIEEAAGMPVLVAYNFKSDLARLLKHFPQGRHLDKRPETIRDWNAGKIPVLFAHPASAGHGLNLQDGGNILVFFSVNWNLEEHLQIIERIGPTRQLQSGYDRPVFIHRILARDTVDELVLQRLQSKRRVQDILMDAMKARKLGQKKMSGLSV